MDELMEDWNRSALRYLIFRQLATVGPAPKTGSSSFGEIIGYVKAGIGQERRLREPDLVRVVECELALLEYENHIELVHVEEPTQYRVTHEGRKHFHELARARPPAAYTPVP